MPDESKPTGQPQVQPDDEVPARRDPETRPVPAQSKNEVRDKMMDKTLADSFPTSDPPSSIPDPCSDDSFGDVKKAS